MSEVDQPDLLPGAKHSGDGSQSLHESQKFNLSTRSGRLWRAAYERGIPLRAILATVAVVALAYLASRLVYELRGVLLIMVVAGFVSLLLNPLVVLLQRLGIRRRGIAVAIVFVAGLAAFSGLAFLFGDPLVNAISQFAAKVPTYVRQAEHGKGWIGHTVRRYHVQRWVQQNAPKLTNLAQNLSKPVLSVGEGALSLLFTLFVTAMLVLLMLLEGTKVKNGFLKQMAPERASQVSRIASEVHSSVTGYMLGNFITSLIAGLVVLVSLEILGVPFPLLWAVWVALVDFLPMIGGILAGVPTVLFAMTHSLGSGVAIAIVFIVYTQVENHVLNPIIMSRTVRINPLLVLIAILVGASLGDLVGGVFGGFVGTLLAIPFAGSITVLIREAWNASDRPSPAPTGIGDNPAVSGAGAER